MSYYIKIPRFLIRRFTPFFILGLILEFTTQLNFIPIILQIRTSLWANQISQVIFWPTFMLSCILFFLPLKKDYEIIPRQYRTNLYLFFVIVTVPLIVLIIEPALYLGEVTLFIPTDFAQTRVSEQKFESITSEIRLLSLLIIPSVTPLTNYLKERRLRYLNIPINNQYEVDLEKFFPVMWMTFIVALCYVSIYNFEIFH